MDRRPFDSPTLKPALEATELRIDLLRQTDETQVNDTVTETENRPYHPLGFDLGNNLFFDLNGNLSLRVDGLLGIRNDPCWSAGYHNRKHQRRPDRVYSFCDEELTVAYPPSKRQHPVRRLITEDGTTTVKYRNRLLYAVDFKDRETVYRRRLNRLDVINQVDDNHFTTGKGLWRDDYRLEENRLLLGRDYIIEINDNNRQIRIIRPGWFRSHVLWTLERSQDCLYVYDRRYYGRKIAVMDGGVEVFRDVRFDYAWKVRKSDE